MKKLVVTYDGTPYVVYDTGFYETPRFELFNTQTQEVVKKSDDPIEFDEILFPNNE